MKMTLEWHEGCYKNSLLYLERERRSLDRAIKAVEELRIRILEYETQINVARERGLDGFDNERFLKKKRNAP